MTSNSKPAWVDRLGDCYTLAWKYVTECDEGWLIHGWVYAGTPRHWIYHAWVELPNDLIYEPIADCLYRKEGFIKAYQADEDRRYTIKEARELAIKFERYGPF